jgi:FKBP-type peptidyl-prolyl cis-trans isomerase 2
LFNGFTSIKRGGVLMIRDEVTNSVPILNNGATLKVTESAMERSFTVRVLPGNTVSIHYTGRLKDGTVFISTENKEPFIFTQGQGEVVPMVQQAVLGMTLGESKIVHISEEEAYGSYKPALAVKVDRAEFSKRGITPEIGLEFGIQPTNGESFPVRVTEIGDSTVTLDANHPLAGHAIIFDLLLVDILSKPETESEFT